MTDPLITLDEVRTIPDMTIGAELNGDHPAGYTWIDLTAPEYATPPDPPAIEGMLYAGRRHVISGPPESTKTLVAYLLLLQALREKEGVCILDFEMGPHAAVTLLRELGATEQELADVHYTEPDGPPTQMDISRITGLGVGYVLLDAAAGAYDTTGLDDNSRKDAETFAGHWIRPLWQQGIATIVIDHVTKNAGTRGKFTIGSERKTGQADVHLSLDAIKPLNRGGSGVIRVTVLKDRPGHMRRPVIYTVHLDSDETSHHITWRLEEPEDTHAEEWRPTIYMEKVSRWLEDEGGAHSGRAIKTGVGGKGEYVGQALKVLVKEGFVARESLGNGHKHRLIEPYRESQDEPHANPDKHTVPGDSQVIPGDSQESDRTSDSLIPRVSNTREPGISQSQRTPNDIMF